MMLVESIVICACFLLCYGARSRFQLWFGIAALFGLLLMMPMVFSHLTSQLTLSLSTTLFYLLANASKLPAVQPEPSVGQEGAEAEIEVCHDLPGNHGRLA